MFYHEITNLFHSIYYGIYRIGCLPDYYLHNVSGCRLRPPFRRSFQYQNFTKAMTYADKDSYMGGKCRSGTYQAIINQIPRHRLYVAGFAGKDGVFQNMDTDARILFIERNPKLVPFYQSLGFKESCFVPLLNNFTSNKRLYRVDDAISFFKEHKKFYDNPETFIYLDPPYPLSSRKSNSRYEFELSDEDHRDLLNTITNYRGAFIAISTYPNEIYTSILQEQNWRVIEFQSRTRGRTATEQLWMNYPEPRDLHDYQYLGEDYRERERIARMQRRWKAKFHELPVLERKAMLQQLQKLNYSL